MFCFLLRRKRNSLYKTEKWLKKQTNKLRYLASVRYVHVVIPIWEATASWCHSSIPWLVWLVALFLSITHHLKAQRDFGNAKKKEKKGKIITEENRSVRSACVCPRQKRFLNDFLLFFFKEKRLLGMIGFHFFHNLIHTYFCQKETISLLFSPLRVDSWHGDFGPSLKQKKTFILHTNNSKPALLHIV